MRIYYAFLIITLLASCKSTSQWEGQGPIQIISTENKEIQIQKKQVFEVGKGVYISNQFEGARLNDAVSVNDTLIRIRINPENEPINTSPWFAFKVWSDQPANLWIEFTYSKGGFHRYFPKISRNGRDFHNADSTSFRAESLPGKRPETAFLKVESSQPREVVDQFGLERRRFAKLERRRRNGWRVARRIHGQKARLVQRTDR